jgi:hypothetical protein
MFIQYIYDAPATRYTACCAPQTSMFPWQQENTAVVEETFFTGFHAEML